MCAMLRYIIEMQYDPSDMEIVNHFVKFVLNPYVMRVNIYVYGAISYQFWDARRFALPDNPFRKLTNHSIKYAMYPLLIHACHVVVEEYYSFEIHSWVWLI